MLNRDRAAVPQIGEEISSYRLQVRILPALQIHLKEIMKIQTNIDDMPAESLDVLEECPPSAGDIILSNDGEKFIVTRKVYYPNGTVNILCYKGEPEPPKHD